MRGKGGLCGGRQDSQEERRETLFISFWDVGQRPQLTLAQFTQGTMELLEEKIRQFPRGTRFNVYQFGETETKNQVLEQRIVLRLGRGIQCVHEVE